MDKNNLSEVLSPRSLYLRPTPSKCLTVVLRLSQRILIFLPLSEQLFCSSFETTQKQPPLTFEKSSVV